ncbi:glycerol-3-phosphate dehydrogenase/oxidase [Ketobacter sp.]|uniref:glycerol-3-phosphate dehydrogenase/oxidase n=1 Tax=Ketobacter sp. TaxID=2083498 RepID=UPI000F1F3A2E|nr:glycerol-3-phosphate dehydrogenase/oxidase [Ketobacter sp.]RLT98009.1 MAG: glycerol-3-phosphate dehydrogenase/oxidase [Ketobacter sp.]
MTAIDRQGTWQQIQQRAQPWDLVIVGGGITGAGILREAARLGLQCLLLEQQDFVWGTSSRSSKMVHGGLRYIAQGDIALTRHSVQERERLIAEAPGLVERLGYLFPIRKGQIPGKLLFNSLLKVYDTLAGIKTQQYFNAKALLTRVPGLNPEQLKGASYYTDAITDDARLVLRVLHEALHEGGLALNYCRAESLLFDSNHDVNGVLVTNQVDGEQQEVKARVVINATGAWVDHLREPVAQERTIRPLRGSHIIIPHELAPVADALTLFHPQDKRAVFIFPWENTTVIGTTDLDHDADLNSEPAITSAEVDYLLHLAQQQFPLAGINRAAILSTFAGVRPVISKDRNKAPSKEKRDHQVWVNQGLVSVSGGKLTTFRLIALDTLKAAAPLLGADIKSLIHGGNSIITPPTLTPAELSTMGSAPQPPLAPEQAARLLGCYGDRAGDIVQLARDGELTPIPPTRFCLAELRWCAREESVVNLDDLLLRRTRLGLLLKSGGEALFGPLQTICRDELGWDEAQWQRQLQRYRNLWQQHYSVPDA